MAIRPRPPELGYYQLLNAALFFLDGLQILAKTQSRRQFDKVKAGGLSLQIYLRLLNDPKPVPVLAESLDNPQYGRTFYEGLDMAFKEETSKAFIIVTVPEMLKVLGADPFFPIVDSNVDRVHTWIAKIRAASPDAVPAAQ